jgi:hypothetical protein
MVPYFDLVSNSRWTYYSYVQRVSSPQRASTDHPSTFLAATRAYAAETDRPSTFLAATRAYAAEEATQSAVRVEPRLRFEGCLCDGPP